MRALLLLALVALASLGDLVWARTSNLHDWVQYKRQHGKVYADKAEDARRLALFLAARDKVERHNANASHSYRLGLNHLSDWTPEEFAQSLSKHRPLKLAPPRQALARSIPSDSATLPHEVDWRKVPNRVTPVKDQGKARTDIAFAAIGVLEGQQVVRNFTQKLVSLSAQQVMDCSYWKEDANGLLREIPAMGGVMAESDYEYVAPAESWCRVEQSKTIMTDSDYQFIIHQPHELEKTVASYGPVGTLLPVPKEVLHYKSGVLKIDLDKCRHVEFDQSLIIVGYGTDPVDGDYWILKNSWGTDWGENGYMRIARGENSCFIEQVPYIAKF